MEKYQKGQNYQTPTRNGNFTKGESIKGSFTLIGMAPIVKPGVAAPPSYPEPSYKFEEGMVDAVDQEGEITRIKVKGIEKFPDGTVALDQMHEYYFQPK
jgi:hypothetical protein